MRERVLLNFLPVHTACYPTFFCFTTDQIVVSQLAVNKSFDFLIGDTFLVSLSDASGVTQDEVCLLYTSPSPRDINSSRMPSSA